MKNRLSVSMTKQELLSGLIFLPFYLVLFSIGLRYLAGEYYPTLDDGWLNLIFYLLCVACILPIFWRFLRDNLRQLKGRGRYLRQELFGNLFRYYIVALAFGVLVTILGNMTGFAFANRNDAKLMELYGDRLWLLLPIAVLLAPFVEESVFRGLIFSNLRSVNRFLAYCVTLASFSFIHVYGYLGTMEPLELAISLLQYVPATVFLCRIYERTDSLFGAMALHGTLNLISLLITTYLFGG